MEEAPENTKELHSARASGINEYKFLYETTVICVWVNIPPEHMIVLIRAFYIHIKISTDSSVIRTSCIISCNVLLLVD
jgi:hypothetical protein